MTDPTRPATPRLLLSRGVPDDAASFLATRLAPLGYEIVDCRSATWFEPSPRDVFVIDASIGRHPLMGGATGWTTVRKQLAKGRQVLALVDVPSALPIELRGRVVTLTRTGEGWGPDPAPALTPATAAA